MNIANEVYRPQYFDFFTGEQRCCGKFEGKPCTNGVGNQPLSIDFLYASESDRKQWVLDHKVEVFKIAESLGTQKTRNITLDIDRAAHAMLSLDRHEKYGEPNLYLRCPKCDSTKRHLLTYGETQQTLDQLFELSQITKLCSRTEEQEEKRRAEAQREYYLKKLRVS